MRRASITAAFAVLAVVVLTAASGAFSGIGTIEGTVVDRSTGAPLFPADVTVVGTGIGGIADHEGRFVIENVPTGHHELKVSMMGYEVALDSNVVVQDGSTTLVDFELTPQVLDIGLQMLVEARHFVKDAERPTSFKSLTPAEIRYAPGALEDVFRVLQSMPGVSPADMTNSNLIVRGGDPTENRTVLENIEIPRPLHFGRPGGSIGGISIVSPSLLERVDFHTGGFPARYGDRMSSVFEMKLRDGSRDHTNTDVNLNLGGFSLVVDGPAPGGGTMLWSVRRGVFDLITSTLGVPALPSYWDVLGKLSYDLGDRHNVSVVGFYFPDDLEMAPDPDGDFRYGMWPGLDLERHDHGNAIGVNWRYLMGGRGYVLTTAAYVSNSWSTLRGNEEDPDLVGDAVREDELRLKSEVNYTVNDRVSLRAGVFSEGIKSQHNTWSIADTTATGYVIPAYHETFTPDPTFKAGSYLQTTLRPVESVAVTTGVRYDYYDFTGESKVSPRVGLAWSMTEGTTFNAAYGHYYQTAAPWQVALHPSNTSLKSSRSVHYVAGFEQLLSDDAQLSLEFYHKELEDAFVHDYSSREITNLGSGYANGVELCIQKRMSGRLTGSLAYSYSMSRRRDRDDFPEYNSEFDRPHNLSLVGSFTPTDDWRIGAKFMYATGSPYTPAVGTELGTDGHWYIVRGEKHSERYPDYHMLDIRVDRTFRFDDWSLLVYLDVWNVYGRRNLTLYHYDVSNDGMLSVTTPDDGLGTIPILGLEAQF